VSEGPSESATTVCDDVAIVAVTGELDFALCLKLAPELNTVLRSAARAVVIDLEAVSLVDSSGIALLLNAFRRLDHAGRQFAIACPMGSPRRAFEITAVDRWLPMHETREAALAAVRASRPPSPNP
jgi:anti-sigma B factor antagonist